MAGKQRDQGLEEADLPPKAAADRHRHDPEQSRIEAEDGRRGLSRREHTLGRRPHGQTAVRLRPRDDDVGLHRGVVDRGAFVSGFDDMRRGTQRRVSVALPEAMHGDDVARGGRPRSLHSATAMSGGVIQRGRVRAKYHRGTGSGCSLHVHHVRKEFVIYRDQPGSVLGRLA